MKESAGVLPYRRRGATAEVLLVHPGGPFWRSRDQGVWQIPKGLVEPGETPEQAARREAGEELGLTLSGALMSLGSIRQAGGKHVHGYALEIDLDAAAVRSNMFEMEWPPRSGRLQAFPEIDAARWMTLAAADAAMLPSQRPLLERLKALLA